MVCVLSYNILYGGQDRIETLASVIRGRGADIVGLQEANEPANVEQLAKVLGLHYALAESRRSPFHVALLSRWPIKEVENLGERCSILQRTALRATITPNGEPWRIVVLHLSPGAKAEQEAFRLQEIEALLSAIGAPAAFEVPTLMMGDFNSPAPSTAAKPGEIAYVARRIAAAGWTDVIARIHGDRLLPTLTTDCPTRRVDYIWLSADFTARLADAGVEQSDAARAASDHFPVWALLRPPTDSKEESICS